MKSNKEIFDFHLDPSRFFLAIYAVIYNISILKKHIHIHKKTSDSILCKVCYIQNCSKNVIIMQILMKIGMLQLTTYLTYVRRIIALHSSLDRTMHENCNLYLNKLLPTLHYIITHNN